MNEINIISISNNLRLIVPDEQDWTIALTWYSNPKILYFSEGIPLEESIVYTIETITKMYKYLGSIGILYFIQIKEKDKWISIGDATVASSNMPIMLGDEKYWGIGIGKKVLVKLLELAKENKIQKVNINIYKYNERSKRLYLSCGFSKISEDETKEYLEYVV